jgi:hypothetical protein
MDGDVLRMKASEPWQLAFPSARLDGGNPLGFYACGYCNVNEALAAGEKLVECFAKKILGVSCVLKLTGDGYNAVYRELNELWQPWELEVMGSLTPEAIDILNGGEVSNTSPSRIPAFTWYCERKPTVYGSLAIQNGKRYLEIASDSGTLEQLQYRVAFLDDLSFEAI